MPDLVSILIPAYNAEKWIRDTIKSALSQTWPRKEIIIVDDGSTDNTLRIAKQSESTIVKVVTQENRGACAARNKAFSLAQGDYIQWLDADDLLAFDKIANQMARSDKGVASQVLLSAVCGHFFYRTTKARILPDLCWKDLTPVEYLLTKFTHGFGMLTHTWLVSRYLTEIAGPWDERLTKDQDGEYSCRLAYLSEGVKFVPEAICYWRRGNFSSLNNDISDKALQSLFLSMSLCIKYLLRLEDSERTRAASIKHLTNNLFYFYPDKHEILQKIDRLAQELSGTILTPNESRKFYLFRKLFGWTNAKKMKNILWKSEEFARRNWDRLLYNLSSK